MRILLITAGAALVGLSATSATAQWRGHGLSSAWRYERAIEQTQRQCAQALRWAESRREYYRIDRRCDARLAELRRDYTRELRRDHWEDDRKWRGRDRDDDDDRRWRGRDRDDDD